RALITRDKGCAFPGCDIRPAWCQAHHIAWWDRDHGPTDVDNGVLLCQRHHTVIHQGYWRITRAAESPSGASDPGATGSPGVISAPGATSDPGAPSATAGGRPWFIPPKHIDPEQQPRRNRHFHLPDLLIE